EGDVVGIVVGAAVVAAVRAVVVARRAAEQSTYRAARRGTRIVILSGERVENHDGAGRDVGRALGIVKARRPERLRDGKRVLVGHAQGIGGRELAPRMAAGKLQALVLTAAVLIATDAKRQVGSIDLLLQHDIDDARDGGRTVER